MVLFQYPLFVLSSWSTCKIQHKRQVDAQQQQGEEGRGAKENLIPHELEVLGELHAQKCQEGICRDKPFFLVFPSGCCFPEEQLRRVPHLPQTSTSPQQTPPSPCQNGNFVDIAVVSWGKSVNKSSLENVPIFPPSSLVKIFQRNKILISLAA